MSECEPGERLTHVLKFEPEATALGQIRLDPLGKTDVVAHAGLPGQGKATSTKPARSVFA